MFEIDHQQIFSLRGTGGEKFTAFCDSLIYATIHYLSILLSDVHINQRVNAKDGGVDSKVDNGSEKDTTGYFLVKSIWQYKATDAVDFLGTKKQTKKKNLKIEVNKPFAKSCIEEGFAYRLCIADYLTPQQVNEIEVILTECCREININSPPVKVLGSGRLLEWGPECPMVEMYPNSIVLSP